MATHKTDLDHALQLRLPKATVAEIDDAIATMNYLYGFNRCKFIRYAVGYALDSIAEESSEQSQTPLPDAEERMMK